MEASGWDGLLARVIAQARAVGIPISEAIAPQVAVNTRAKTRFGACRSSGGRHQIELSALLEGAGEWAVCQVLAHEILHTCPGCANHGARWQKWAGRMNQVYGYHISRTDSFAALGVEDTRPVRYVLVCQGCGTKIRRMKRSALVEHPERYRCRCGGRLKVYAGQLQTTHLRPQHEKKGE